MICISRISNQIEDNSSDFNLVHRIGSHPEHANEHSRQFLPKIFIAESDGGGHDNPVFKTEERLSTDTVEVHLAQYSHDEEQAGGINVPNNIQKIPLHKIN